MLYIKHYLLILPLFVAIYVIWLPGLTYGVYAVLFLKSGTTSVVKPVRRSQRILSTRPTPWIEFRSSGVGKMIDANDDFTGSIFTSDLD
jgi:hypothetical protein